MILHDHHRRDRQWLAYAALAVALVATARGKSGPNGDLTGAAMALGAAAFFAAYLLATERVREEMDTLTFNVAAIVGSTSPSSSSVCCSMCRSRDSRHARGWR